MSATSTTKVLVVDDVLLIRTVLKVLLAKTADIEVIGEAENGQQSLEAVGLLEPDVVLMDVSMPIMDGIEAAKLIRQNNQKVKIIMLTAKGNEEDIFAAFDAGADGYILKDDFAGSVELAIRTVKFGSVWLDPAIARRVLQLASVREPGRTSLKAAEPPRLSVKDSDVLASIASAKCEDGICLVSPSFLDKLRRLGRKSISS